MSDLPDIAIAMVTFRRTDMAIRTIESTCDNLIYPRTKRSWYIGDDGSGNEHMDRILETLRSKGENIMGFHNERMRKDSFKDKPFPGIGWNKALGIAHQNSDFVLWLEDDWDLDEHFDLKPYVLLLKEQEDVGICSFRILSTGAAIKTVGYGGEVYFDYERTTQYAYSGNPYLRHARYTKHYGWFREDCNPGNIELKQDDLYRLAVEGPRIWRPAGISVWGAWKHIGTDKTWS